MNHLGGGGDTGCNFPLPIPFNPGSHPVSVGSCLLAFFRLQNIVQCCVLIFLFSPASCHLGNPASRPLFSRLPYTSCLLFSWSPAPCPSPLSIINTTTISGIHKLKVIRAQTRFLHSSWSFLGAMESQ